MRREKDSREIVIVSGAHAGRRCGVLDYSERLAKELRAKRNRVSVWNLSNWGCAHTLRLYLKLLRFMGVLHVQFPSQGMQRRFGPHLMLPFAIRARRIVTFHEYSRMTWRGKLLSLPSLICAHRIVTTNPSEAAAIGALLPFVRHKIVSIAIGSNIPVGRVSIDDQRELAFFGLIEDDFPVSTFLDVVERAGLDDEALLIGHADVSDPSTRRVIARAKELGVALALNLPSEEVANILAGIKVALLPYGDGISERRGTALAAMSNEVLIVTTPPQDAGGVKFDDMCLMADSVDSLAELTHEGLRHVGRFKDKVTNAKRHANLRSWPTIAAQHAELFEAEPDNRRSRNLLALIAASLSVGIIVTAASE